MIILVSTGDLTFAQEEIAEGRDVQWQAESGEIVTLRNVELDTEGVSPEG